MLCCACAWDFVAAVVVLGLVGNRVVWQRCRAIRDGASLTSLPADWFMAMISIRKVHEIES